MAYSISWSDDARNELKQIISYIKEKSGNIIAANVFQKIRQNIERLTAFPGTGRVSPELEALGITYIHQINENPWRIYYKIENEIIWIVSIIDTRRNIEELLYKKMIDGKLK
jgi:toxin ParE1/3/4